MEAFLVKDPSLKETAQKAVVQYVKAVFLMKDKEVFDVHSLDTDAFAHSLGLEIPPRIRFLQRLNAKQDPKMSKNFNNKKKYFNTYSDEEDNENKNEHNVISGEPTVSKESLPSDDSDSDDNIFKVKSKDHDIELPTEEEMAELHLGKNKSKKPITKAALAKKILKKKIVPNKKIVFNEEGEAIAGIKEKKSDLALQYENEEVAGIDIEQAKLVLKEEDKFDKQLFKQKVKAKHKETKRKLKEKKKKKEEESRDEFDESGSEDEPDLSWLPDPDKVYDKHPDEDPPTLENEVASNTELDEYLETAKKTKK